MILRWMFRLLLVFCAGVFSQFPVFVNQYLIRIDGHCSELDCQIRVLEKIAGDSGKSLNQYIEKFLQQADKDFLAQGAYLQGLVERRSKLFAAKEELARASPALRPLHFFRKIDKAIASETWGGFVPGLYWTKDVLIWAAMGAGCGLLFAWLLGRLRGLFA